MFGLTPPSAAPSQATGHQLGAEAVAAAAHFGNTTATSNRDAQYVVVSPTGTHPDGFNTANGNFCAWHDYNGDSTLSGGAVSSSYGDIAFTNLPYIPDLGASCGANYVNGGTAGSLDGVTIVEGHEYAETITDQNPAGGWTDSLGFETADKCAWVGVGGTGGAQNVTFSTGSFAMQATWANDANSCEISHAIVTNGSGGGGGGGGGGANGVIVNGGFESGNLTGWTVSGPASVSSTAHSGSYSAELKGSSSIAQTFTAPTGATMLSFWYQNNCPNGGAYPFAYASLADTTLGTTAIPLDQTCVPSAAWTQVQANIQAGHTYTLTLYSYSTTNTPYTLYDDVAVNVSGTNDFGLSASPGSVSVVGGSSGTTMINTTVVSGAAQPVTLSLSGAPTGVSGSFSPNPVTAGASSTLTLIVSGSAALGSSTVTVTGTGNGSPPAVHTTPVNLTVTTNDFGLSASPGSVSVVGGSSGTTMINTTVVSGAAQPVTLSLSGAPTGVSGSFSPNPVTAGASSTLTLIVSGSAALGSSTVTVTGTGNGSPPAVHTTPVNLTVTTNDFGLSASPGSVSVVGGSSGTTMINTTVVSGAAQPVTLSLSGAPTGVSGSFSPNPVTAGASSTLTLIVSGSAALGSSTVTVTGTGNGSPPAVHTTPVNLTVTTNDFGLSASPGSVSVVGGSSGTTMINTTVVSGAAQPVTLSLSGAPTGVSGSFSPNPVTAGASSTLTLIVSGSAALGSSTVTVTGTGNGSPPAVHTTPVNLTVAGANGVIVNGGFESGNLTGWTVSGPASVSSTAHSGSYSAELKGSSSIAQTFTAPTGATMLSFWYQNNCPNGGAYPFAYASLADTTLGTTAIPLDQTCVPSAAWTQVQANIQAGHTYTLTLYSYSTTNTPYTLYDDVAVNVSGTNDFGLSASPGSVSVVGGSSGTTMINTTVVSGAAQPVTLSLSGAPTGVSGSFSPNPVTAGASSTLTLIVSGSAALGSSTVTVTGTGNGSPPAVHTTPVNLTVTTNDFGLSASPGSVSVVGGSSGTTMINTTVVSGAAQPVTLSLSGAPTGVSGSFSPNPVTAGASSTLTLIVSGSAALGSSTVTVTGTGNGSPPAVHTTPVNLTVTTNDFGLSASPGSVSVVGGSSGTTMINTTVVSGAAQPVTLSLSGAPTGVSGSFSPNPVTAGASSTLTLIVSGSAALGSSTVTVTGTGNGSPPAVHTTPVNLTVAGANGVIVNGGFESGNLTGWTVSGPASVSSTAHSGSYSAELKGSSSIAQTFTAPTGATMLSFWYQNNCPNGGAYPFAYASLADTTLGTTAIPLDQTCVPSAAWTQVQANIQAGHTYTLTLYSYSTTNTPYTLYDDVAVR